MASAAGVDPNATTGAERDVYFSVDVETDGPIPGDYSMLSFALVLAGTFDGERFLAPAQYDVSFDAELQPVGAQFDPAALAVNGLDRERLRREGRAPAEVMREASSWVDAQARGGTPVLVAYPLGFDWAWLHWYFVKFTGSSPFRHSRGFDLKTAIAVRGRRCITQASHRHLPPALRSERPHTHRALDDAIEQADVLAKLFAWDGT